MQKPSSDSLGLVFFAKREGRAHRRRRLIFVGLGLLVTAMLSWPLALVGARLFPLVLGLPFSLVWVVIALLIMFGGLIWLFLHDGDSNLESGPQGARRTESGS